MPWSLQQVAEHNSSASCWIIIHGKVYDLTDFLPEHPGGPEIILKYAGCNATSAYETIHSVDLLDAHLPRSKHLGEIEPDAAVFLQKQEQDHGSDTSDNERTHQSRMEKPPLSWILNLKDMETVARRILSRKALAYYSSGADDEITMAENGLAFSRFFFHPRVLRPVGTCNTSTTILGFKSTLPIFIGAAALAKLGHPLGERNLAKAAAIMQIPQVVSSNASFSPASIISAATVTYDPTSTSPHQNTANAELFYQLYKHKSNATAAQRVREVERLGYKAIWLTVDAFVPGNRERDVKAAFEGANPMSRDVVVDMGGTAGKMLINDDLDMSWEQTISWLRSVTKLPIVLKGIQCVEDAVLAAKAGVEGILLSNHGGRQLDYSLPPVEILYRLRKQRPDVFEKLEVYIDGGITRGTDILKALCFGATAVGLGRAFLYGQSAYGAEGAVKVVQILHREILTGMRLLGARTIRELTPDMVERVDWQPLTRAKL